MTCARDRIDPVFLRSTFRRLLAVSLAVPLGVACGGSIAGSEFADDASAPDADTPDARHSPPDSGVIDDGGSLPDRQEPPPDGAFADHHVDAGPCDIPPGSCQYVLSLSCSDAGMQDAASPDCKALCHFGQTGGGGCNLTTVNGDPSVVCYTCGVGRRPRGLVESAPSRASLSELGRYFAAVSYLEAASIDAFRILRDELEAHGAPVRLVRAAERAARDEVRHAKATSRLARRHGAEPMAPLLATRARRSLEEIAIENAVEGCVRETFGALEATWQAKAARDPAVRAAMERIAQDETRHASLAWAVDAWAQSRLAPAARARVARARRGAVAKLAREARVTKSPELVREAGVLDPRHATELVRAMRAELWAA
jgi:hypothetical protein